LTPPSPRAQIALASHTKAARQALLDDYPFATIHLVTFCAKGSRTSELVFGWVELLPHGFPQPRSVAPARKSVRPPFEGFLFHSRTVMTGERVMEWYEDAIRGAVVTPEAIDKVAPELAGISVSSRLVREDPTWPQLGLFTGPHAQDSLNYELPFVPDWTDQPRIHRMSADPEQHLVAVATRPDLARWLANRIWIDFAVHPEWLGALAVVAPNPLWSEMHHRKLPASEDSGERSLLRFVPRPGADLKGLQIMAYERKLGMIGPVSRGRPGTASALLLAHEARSGAIGVVVHDETRGLLHASPPTPFLEAMQLTMSVASGTREMTAPTTVSPSAPQESFSATDYVDTQTRFGWEGTEDLAVLAAARRRERRAAEAFGQRWFGSDPQTAAAFIRTLIGQARTKVHIYDPYVTSLELFRFLQAVTRRTVGVRAVTSSLPFKTQPPVARERMVTELEQEEARLKEYRRGASPVEISILRGKVPPLHDRFLVIDEEIWFTGNSLATLGNRAGMIIRLPDPAPIAAELERLFRDAEPIEAYLKRTRGSHAETEPEE